MAAARKPAHELILDNFVSRVELFEGAIRLQKLSAGKDYIGESRIELMRAGTMVRRMQLKPRQRDYALDRLRPLKPKVDRLLTEHGLATMNARWFNYVLKRVEMQ